MAASITICNLALGELRASAIADIAEDSIEAQNCARYYPQCLKLLLERHDWSFATRIASLAELSVNPRASEWLHAYALPVDCATPKRLVPPLEGVVACWPVEWRQAFIVEAGLLYTQIPGALLEYSSDDVPEAVMPALFADALAYALAARLAVPIRDSREMKGQLLQQAELAAMRAMADDENREPRRDLPFSDEVMAARSGGLAGQVY
ncbi:MAG: hypothetical protein ABI471_11225 [Sphingomonas bacterium]